MEGRRQSPEEDLLRAERKLASQLGEAVKPTCASGGGLWIVSRGLLSYKVAWLDLHYIKMADHIGECIEVGNTEAGGHLRDS